MQREALGWESSLASISIKNVTYSTTLPWEEYSALMPTGKLLCEVAPAFCEAAVWELSSFVSLTSFEFLRSRNFCLKNWRMIGMRAVNDGRIGCRNNSLYVLKIPTGL